MSKKIKDGSTNVSVRIRIIDDTDGTPEQGVTSASGGLALWYQKEGAAKVELTESDLSALTDAHSDGGMLHIDDGYYRVDIPDAAFTGADSVLIGGAVTGMIVIGSEIQIVEYDPNDSVRLGLTALPNAAADAAGGLPISDAGGLDLDTQLANAVPTVAAIRTEIDSNSTQLAAIVADTNELQTDLADGGRLDLIFDELTTQGDTNETKLDTIDTVVDAVLVDTASTIPALITALNDPSVADILTTVMTESYASKGAAPSLAQILFELRSLLAEHAAVGTTLTTKKIDGSTTAATYTFDDASNPTSITRAT